MPVPPVQLTRTSVATAAQHLAKRDRDLSAVLQAYGPPPLWARQSGFATLIHIILEQQVSLASAQAAFDKLAAKVGRPITPESVLALTDEELKAAYFSRQKMNYARNLADAVLDKSLDLE